VVCCAQSVVGAPNLFPIVSLVIWIKYDRLACDLDKVRPIFFGRGLMDEVHRNASILHGKGWLTCDPSMIWTPSDVFSLQRTVLPNTRQFSVNKVSSCS
jgi:hypothetical protein